MKFHEEGAEVQECGEWTFRAWLIENFTTFYTIFFVYFSVDIYWRCRSRRRRWVAVLLLLQYEESRLWVTTIIVNIDVVDVILQLHR